MSWESVCPASPNTLPVAMATTLPGPNPTRHLELPFLYSFLHSANQQGFTVYLLERLGSRVFFLCLCRSSEVLGLVSWRDSMRTPDWEPGDLGQPLAPYFVWDLEQVTYLQFLLHSTFPKGLFAGVSGIIHVKG